jgi:hypothetical protein
MYQLSSILQVLVRTENNFYLGRKYIITTQNRAIPIKALIKKRCLDEVLSGEFIVSSIPQPEHLIVSVLLSFFVFMLFLVWQNKQVM